MRLTRPLWPFYPSFNTARSFTHFSSRSIGPSCNCQAVNYNKHGQPVPAAKGLQEGSELDREASQWSHHAAADSSHQDFYTLDPSSPGSPLFQPFGTHVLLKLQAFLRAQYPTYGIQEVLSPTIYKKSLWEKSGHWDNYKDDMFSVTGRVAQASNDPGQENGKDEEFGLKPMNCPGHCLLFKSRRRSYKDLPVRYADFSPLHRNELSGALSGLTRLRRFHQDDGHIFCRPAQVASEIGRTLHFVQLVYGTFDLGDYELRLGTRPENDYIGDINEWKRAEDQLVEALRISGRSYRVQDGDGAFYGPKIDIILKDKAGKEHQTATIQLDFQLPKRFQLEYDAPIPENGVSEANSSAVGNKDVHRSTPVLIHRAILGSLERFFALLIERHHPHWPFWLSHRQLIILSVGTDKAVRDAAEAMAKELRTSLPRDGPQLLGDKQFSVQCDTSDNSISKKIVNARKDGYSMYGVLGKKNIEDGTIDVTVASLPNSKKIWYAFESAKQGAHASRDSDESENLTHKPSAVKLDKEKLRKLMVHLTDSFL
ncbi:MAG: hypothetical protein Q9190_007878 [Brigantiaea leucoxantha]